MRGGVGSGKEGLLEEHGGSGSGAQKPLPSQSLLEALSTPLPAPPIRGLYLHPSPSASAGCNPQSPASSTSPTRGSPAILHPHLVSSHTPSACLSPKPASSPGLLDHPLPPPRAHPLTPTPLDPFSDPHLY